MKNPIVLNNYILKFILLSYIIEISIWALGSGRYDFSPRYNAFFNDPNQMAFWVLSTCSIYLYISKNRIYSIIIYLLAFFLIAITLSRSALLGIPLLTIGLILKQEGSLKKKLALSSVSAILVIIIFIVLFKYGYLDDLISRFTQGIEEKDSQAQGRGFTTLLQYPEYLIFGAGQGNYEQYSASGHEIHSTWLGILFYYGVIGLSIILAFFYQITRRLSLANSFLFLSPMLYGFTTYSIRTTVFWFLIAIFLIPLETDKA